LFGIVGVLVAVDIVFLAAVSSARLRRKQKQIEGNDVSIFKVINDVIS